MAGLANMANVTNALKIFYLPGMQYQLATSTPLLAEMEHDTESVVGSEVHMALRYGRNGGTGMRADDGTLPTAQTRKTVQAIFQTVNFFANVQITDKVIRASAKKEGAFEDLLQAELDDALSDSRDNINRQLFNDGTGKMASITAAAWAANVLTLTVSSTQYFAEGQQLDVIDGDANPQVALANGSNLVVTEVDDVNLKVMLSDTTDIHATIDTVNDFLVISGDVNGELTGLGSVLGTVDNTVYGIDRSTNKWFNPTQIAVNGEIADNVMQKAQHTVAAKAGSDIDFWIASYGVARAYGDYLIAERQLVNPGTVKLEGGYEVVTFRGKPFTEDRYAPASTLYGLHLKSWKLYEMDKPNWLDRDGAVLSRLPTQPVWQATLAWYLNPACNLPRGNAVLQSITEH